MLSHNKSKLPGHELNILMRMIETRCLEIVSKWQERFGEISFYC